MSEVTTVNSTNNQAHFDYDVSKVFVWDNRYESGTFVNDSGAEADFLPGTVLGRIGATGKLVQVDSTAVDGSQYPVGILLTYVNDLANAGEQTVRFCVGGDVVEDKLVYKGAETGATVVGTVQFQDWIRRVGIKLVDSAELTDYDNQ